MDQQRQFDEWLDSTARSFRYPATPTLGAGVAARLQAQPAPGRWPEVPGLPTLFVETRWLRGLAAAVFAVLLATGLATALSPSVRAEIASFFRLGRVEVVRVEGPLPTPTPPTAESREVAGRTTLAEARRMAGFDIGTPSYPEGLGEPDAVYFQDLRPGGTVVLVYEAKPSLALQPRDAGKVLFALFQIRAEGVFQKSVPTSTTIQEPDVGVSRALWLEGFVHRIQYIDDKGETRTALERLVEGNTLIWEARGTTLRLETSSPREEAVKIAESLQYPDGS